MSTDKTHIHSTMASHATDPSGSGSKISRRILLATGGAAAALLAAGAFAGWPRGPRPALPASAAKPDMAVSRLLLSEDQWRERLTAEQFEILRQGGTEPAFDNRYYDHHQPGIYTCVACDNHLFDSTAKFESGTGWPSFYRPINTAALLQRPDDTLFLRRTEVICSRCEGHIGHVFNDGPQPTGLRFCVNSAALAFSPED